MSERDLVMIPGPTNVDPKVLRTMARPILAHTSGAFTTIFKEALADLGRIFKTNGVVLPLAGTGTLGAEVALSNIIEPGDKVLVISGGYFGDRLAEIAVNLGAAVDILEVPWGKNLATHSPMVASDSLGLDSNHHLNKFQGCIGLNPCPI